MRTSGRSKSGIVPGKFGRLKELRASIGGQLVADWSRLVAHMIVRAAISLADV